MKQKEQITTAEFSILVFIGGLAVKMFMLPALLMKVSGKDSVFVMAFYLAFEMLNVILLVATAKRNPDKTYYQILQDTLGKIGAKIIVVWFSLFLIIKALLILSEIKVFFSVSVYDRITWSIMIIPIIALCLFYGTKTLRTIGRTGEIFMPFIAISAILLSFLLIGDVPFSNLFPFFENGTRSFLTGANTFTVWFGDVSVLVVCLGNVKQSKHFALTSIISRIVSVIIVFLFSTIMFATYSNISELVDYGHNVSSMTQYSLGSHDYGRFDYLIYCFWLFAVLIKLMLIFYTLVRNVGYVFNAKSNTIISIVLSVLVYVLTSFVLKNENSVYSFCTGIIKHVVAPTEFFLPLALFIMARIVYKKATEVSSKDEYLLQNSQHVLENKPQKEGKL